MIYSEIYSLIFFTFQVFAGGGIQESAQRTLEDMTLTYSQVEYMKADFVKISKSSLLGTEERTKGALEYSKGKFRLEVKTKPKSIFIKGASSFWHINDGDVVIGNSKKAVPSIFESIFSDVTIWSKLKTSYVSVPAKIAEIKVDTVGKVPNVIEMILSIDLKKRTLVKLVYTDDVNNSVDIDFKRIRFFPNSKPSRFHYKVKKTDNVSRM